MPYLWPGLAHPWGQVKHLLQAPDWQMAPTSIPPHTWFHWEEQRLVHNLIKEEAALSTLFQGSGGLELALSMVMVMAVTLQYCHTATDLSLVNLSWSASDVFWEESRKSEQLYVCKLSNERQCCFKKIKQTKCCILQNTTHLRNTNEARNSTHTSQGNTKVMVWELCKVTILWADLWKADAGKRGTENVWLSEQVKCGEGQKESRTGVAMPESLSSDTIRYMPRK